MRSSSLKPASLHTSNPSNTARPLPQPSQAQRARPYPARLQSVKLTMVLQDLSDASSDSFTDNPYPSENDPYASSSSGSNYDATDLPQPIPVVGPFLGFSQAAIRFKTESTIKFSSLSLSLSLCALDLDLDSRRVSLSLIARSTSRTLSTPRSRFPGPSFVARLVIRRKSTYKTIYHPTSLILSSSSTLYPTPTRLPSSTLRRTLRTFGSRSY